MYQFFRCLFCTVLLLAPLQGQHTNSAATSQLRQLAQPSHSVEFESLLLIEENRPGESNWISNSLRLGGPHEMPLSGFQLIYFNDTIEPLEEVHSAAVELESPDQDEAFFRFLESLSESRAVLEFETSFEPEKVGQLGHIDYAGILGLDSLEGSADNYVAKLYLSQVIQLESDTGREFAVWHARPALLDITRSEASGLRMTYIPPSGTGVRGEIEISHAQSVPLAWKMSGQVSFELDSSGKLSSFRVVPRPWVDVYIDPTMAQTLQLTRHAGISEVSLVANLEPEFEVHLDAEGCSLEGRLQEATLRMESTILSSDSQLGSPESVIEVDQLQLGPTDWDCLGYGF